MPDFAATHTITAATCAILALTWFCHLSMCLGWKKWKMTPADPPPYYGIFHNFFKFFFEPFPNETRNFFYGSKNDTSKIKKLYSRNVSSIKLSFFLFSMFFKIREFTVEALIQVVNL